MGFSNCQTACLAAWDSEMCSHAVYLDNWRSFSPSSSAACVLSIHSSLPFGWPVASGRMVSYLNPSMNLNNAAFSGSLGLVS